MALNTPSFHKTLTDYFWLLLFSNLSLLHNLKKLKHMENLTNFSTILFTLCGAGFILAYSVVLGKVFAKPIKAFFSMLF